MTELKPGPFCGRDAYLRNRGYCWEVRCVSIECDAVQRSADRNDVIEKWNRRSGR